MTILKVFAVALVALFSFSGAHAQAQPASVLWWNGMAEQPPHAFHRSREEMANYLNAYRGGQDFRVTFKTGLRGGGLAQALSQGSYDIVILDVTDRSRRINGEDTAALQRHYASGKRQLMLDGSFWIRNMRTRDRTRFPGPGESMAGILVNQVAALAEAGGGILIGVDHGEWQRNGNIAMQALVPGARFRGVTNPSTDGDFIGDVLLGRRASVTARDVLRHWEAVPNQGEAPVGTFTDFMGQPIELFSLVETADKPGGGRKRPYISSTIFPGEGTTDIDSTEPMFSNLPTHKSGTN